MIRLRASLAAAALAAALGACGGGGAGPAEPPPALPSTRLSGPTPVPADCGLAWAGGGTPIADAEVEPWVAVDPADPRHLVAAWQQDRWTNGGARAIVSAASFDGGRRWRRVLHPMSRCGGGAGSHGDYERVSDPWVDIAPDGTVHLMALAFSGSTGSAQASAMLASRSADGGLRWSAPVALIADGAAFFNDKNTLTADPVEAGFVYAVWDRLDNVVGGGPTWFTRSTDGGRRWEAARAIHDPGRRAQTIGNRIVVLPGGPERGLLVNVFTEIDYRASPALARVRAMRSADQGASWSVPVTIGELRAVGTVDAATSTPVRDGSILSTVAASPAGALWVAWQDARPNGGRHDAIVVSRSGDGGRNWSEPLAANLDRGAPAFTPSLVARGDGLVGLMHFDLRDDSADPATLFAGAWLLTTRDGGTWTESPVWSPFDMAGAPRVDGGLFLGDYQGLAATATAFVPVLALATGDRANPSDVFAPWVDDVAIRLRAQTADRRHGAAAGAGPGHALDGGLSSLSDEALARRVGDNIVAFMERRIPGWGRRVGAPAEAP